jgi:hypothetical protein
MTRSCRFLFVLSCILVAAPALADQGIPDLSLCTAEFTDYVGAGTLVVRFLPDGGAPGFAEAHVMNTPGSLRDAGLMVRVLTTFGEPVIWFPWEDVWVEPTGGAGTLASCRLPGEPVIVADPESSDLEGRIFFSGARAAGGWSEGSTQVFVAGGALLQMPLALRFVSPDINGDLVVNLSDTGFFVGDLFGTYHIRSDLNADGVIDLSDSGFMATAIGTSCP